MIDFIFDGEILKTGEKFHKELQFERLKDCFTDGNDLELISVDSNLVNNNILENLDLGIDVLKLTDDGTDFILQFSNRILWDILDIPLKKIQGAKFRDLFKIADELNVMELLFKVNNGIGRINSKVRVYSEGKLIYYIEEFLIKSDKDGLLYFFNKDKTKECINNSETWDLFDDSKLAIFNLRSDGKVTRVNQGLYDIAGYTADDFNEIGLSNIILDYEFEDSSSFSETLSKIFNRELAISNSKVKCVMKDGTEKIFRVYSVLIEKNIIRTICEDISDIEQMEFESLNLKNTLNEFLGLGNLVMANVSNGVYSWNENIFNLLEIDSNDFDLGEDLISLFVLPEDVSSFKANFDSVLDGYYSFDVNFRVKTLKGNIKHLSGIIKGEFTQSKLIDGFALLQDVTEFNLTSNLVSELENILDEIKEMHNIVLYSYKNGKFKFTNGIYDMLNIKEEDFPEGSDYLQKKAIPEDKELLNNLSDSLSFENPYFHITIRVKSEDSDSQNDLKYISVMGNCVFDENENLVSIGGSIIDETNRFLREKELKELSEDRKILLQEVHHRVKNNLQIILSLLNLEFRYNSDDPLTIIDQTRNRINSMALIHESIYNSSDIAHVNIKDYVVKEMNDLFRVSGAGHITEHYDVANIELSMNKSIPLGLIFNELAINATKYAFPDKKEGNFFIDLDFDKETKEVSVDIYDDGVGLPKDFNVNESNSLGFTIIQNLVRQLEGQIQMIDCDGFGISIKFVDDLLNVCD